ncbi:succinate dehydrogenase/fumarate reductase iron-sulfur subunit [Tessaracoccus flavescens]|uniref:Succinate dehydrogenase n=1 Tax=Tessaracoccus flavescens TaxID=399497 RepID=A0A1Q2CXB9_9ACTN|nr:succinate dehydrogenase/fumarate reductase iron-sulfur subunit [Tessaracoccus flavescens]AQP50707.1 succinate dehydrogenase [Tessaracoccus flavescens]
MRLTVEIWRQAGPEAPGAFEAHQIDGVDPHLSVLELLDALNEQLIDSGHEPFAFESDCREGICGACGVTVDGDVHGPEDNVPSCHQRLVHYADGSTVRIEPMRSAAFPVLRDLIVDRGGLDDVIRAGGHVAVDAGTAPDADAIPIPTLTAEESLDFAACIGCGACVAACPNGAAHLFAGAKLTHLAMLPIPSQERTRRARAMVTELEDLFGPCSLYGECERACPAGIPLTAIAAVNHERFLAGIRRQL